jgi:hypothetical protein
MPGVLHVVVATLRAGVPDEAVARAVDAARALRDAPGVEAVMVGRSGEQLVVATWLGGREALELFASSRPHMAFVMQGLAPVIRGMWSAAVESDTPPPAPDAVGALWAFALPEAEGVYEWQVRDLLARIEALPGTAAVGPTVEERERYRAGGVVCVPEPARAEFDARLDITRREWNDLAEAVDEALVAVLPA